MRYTAFARTEVEHDAPDAPPDERLRAAVLARLGPLCAAARSRPRVTAPYLAEQRTDYDAAMRRAALDYELRSVKVHLAFTSICLSICIYLAAARIRPHVTAPYLAEQRTERRRDAPRRA